MPWKWGISNALVKIAAPSLVIISLFDKKNQLILLQLSLLIGDNLLNIFLTICRCFLCINGIVVNIPRLLQGRCRNPACSRVSVECKQVYIGQVKIYYNGRSGFGQMRWAHCFWLSCHILYPIVRPIYPTHRMVTFYLCPLFGSPSIPQTIHPHASQT